MSASNDNKICYDAGRRDTCDFNKLLQTFRPVLELAFPNVATNLEKAIAPHGLDHDDVKQEEYDLLYVNEVLDIFCCWNIRKLCQLVVFDWSFFRRHNQIDPYTERPYLIPDDACKSLGYICDYINMEGAKAFMNWLDQQKDSDPGQIMVNIRKQFAGVTPFVHSSTTGIIWDETHHYKQIKAKNKTLILCSLAYARVKLEEWMHHEKRCIFANSSSQRTKWPLSKVLQLFEIYPTLAVTEISNGDRFHNESYPVFYLLQCGFPIETVRKVHDIYPPMMWEFSKQHMIDELLKSAKRGYSVPLKILKNYEYFWSLSLDPKKPRLTDPGLGGKPKLLATAQYKNLDSQVFAHLMDHYSSLCDIQYAFAAILRSRYDIGTVEALLDKYFRGMDKYYLEDSDGSGDNFCAKALALQLPRLRSLTCILTEYSRDGFLNLMDLLSDPTLSSTLEFLKIRLPDAQWTTEGCDSKGGRCEDSEKNASFLDVADSLQKVIVHGMPSVKNLSFSMKEWFDDDDDNDERMDGEWLVSILISVRDIISTKGRKIDKLTLTGFRCSDSVLASGSNTYCSKEELATLFSEVVARSHIQALEIRCTDKEESHGGRTFNFFEENRLTTFPVAATGKLKHLVLDDVSLANEVWKSAWKHLTEVESITCFPRPTCGNIGLKMMMESTIPAKLKTVNLGPRQLFTWEDVDATELVVSLIQQTQLEGLLIYGIHDEAYERGCTYIVDMSVVAEALKHNTTMKELKLCGVEMESDTEAAGHLLIALQTSNNATLERVTLCDERNLFTVSHNEVMKRGPRSLAPFWTPESLQLQHLLLLNEFGRKNMQEGTTMHAVVSALTKVESVYRQHYEEDKTFVEDLIRAAADDGKDGLNSIFYKVRGNTHRMEVALHRHEEHASILFGLFREFPPAWCLQDNGNSPLKKASSKKRKRDENM